MAPTETYCENCGEIATDTTAFCPDCGAKDPWAERPAYEFDDSDLPIVFSTRAYDDDYGLWDAFCEEYFGTRLTGDEVVGLPEDFPQLSFYEVDLYWTITESLDVEGPFLSKDAAYNVTE